MCCLFSIGNRLQKKGSTHWYCFSVPDNSIYCCWDPATSFVVLPWNHSVRQRNKFTQFTKCDVHHSQWDHSTSSPNLPSVTISNRVMYSNLHCESYQCNDRWSPLYIVTVAPFCHESPFISYYSVIMLPDVWSCCREFLKFTHFFIDGVIDIPSSNHWDLIVYCQHNE